MSLILDALRRAETQRHTQMQPVYSLPSGQRTRSADGPFNAPPAVLAALATAVLIIAVLITWLAASRPGAGAAPVVVSPLATPATRPASAQSRSPAPRTRPSSSREVSSLAAAARADGAPRSQPTPPRTISPNPTTPGSVQIVSAPASSANTNQGAAIAPGTVVVRDLLAEEGISAGSSITVATTAPEALGTAPPPAARPAPPPGDAGAVANLAAAPTEFTLNMLSTSADPANSYVYVNMRRYQIGDQTAEGAIIDDISNAGAVIRYRGQRYLLKSR